MIQWVYERASMATALSQVIVATDDPRIEMAVHEFGGAVVMTSPHHTCGTDRLAEVVRSLPDVDIVVNIQGDEPAISPQAIDLAVNRLMNEHGAAMSTLVTPCSTEEYENPNVVKAVMDQHGFALYFSRSPLPFQRSRGTGVRVWKHIGLYAYRRDFLLLYTEAPPTPLEKAESLEQLRALEMGHRIAIAVSAHPCVGVDTPEDVVRAEESLKHAHNL
jgi:3-deoxy-manno-octulosonate cytidylyltransferase (CMP-KDO synthetase)